MTSYYRRMLRICMLSGTCRNGCAAQVPVSIDAHEIQHPEANREDQIADVCTKVLSSADKEMEFRCMLEQLVIAVIPDKADLWKPRIQISAPSRHIELPLYECPSHPQVAARLAFSATPRMRAQRWMITASDSSDAASTRSSDLERPTSKGNMPSTWSRVLGV